ncbi:MAG: FadR/GntR family transcriptional regulator [Actinomycetes bacterium]
MADQIVTAIALGHFLPGQRLPAERDLAERLGVSRGTVREALAQVAAAGLVEIRRGRTGGAYVQQPWSARSAEAIRTTLEPQWATLEEAFDLRGLVEGLVARTAAERRDSRDATGVAAALRAYEQARDLTAAQSADLRLHHAVARATKNPRLVRLRQTLLTEVNIGFAVEPFTEAVYARALPQHQQLARAVVDGDAEAAWRIGSAHFTITADELRAALVRAAGLPPARSTRARTRSAPRPASPAR